VEDATLIKLQPPLTLRIVEGPGAGNSLRIEYTGAVVIGRHPECGFILDEENKAASRRHARLTVKQGNVLQIEDLGSNNGVIVQGERITSTGLKPGDSFTIGQNVLLVKDADRSVASAPVPETDEEATVYKQKAYSRGKAKPNRVRLLLLALLLLSGLAILYVAVTNQEGGDKPGPAGPQAEEPAEQPAESVAQEQGAGPGPAPLPAPEPPPSPAIEALPSPSAPPEPEPAAATGEADKHFQQGMFFYKAGNLARAVKEWRTASGLDPANDTAQKWLLRAEKELDELIDKHYRQGLMAYKYMRYDEASSEFNLVVQWSGSQDDERYKDARQKLDELEEKR
jgi:pSer/pThr/pTyr-binding forkhead associated (FHA) protein